MSKNALALVDCNNREQLYQFLVENFDRKAVKNEMISPYDDQLIGKMNFIFGGLEHAMFFTYARSSEYPGMRFRNHKIIYLSLGVNDTSADIFNQICAKFGGFIDYNDEMDKGWQKKDRQKPLVEDKTEWQEASSVEKTEGIDPQQEIRQILKLDRTCEWQEEEQERKENNKTNNRNKTVEKAQKVFKTEQIVDAENE